MLLTWNAPRSTPQERAFKSSLFGVCCGGSTSLVSASGIVAARWINLLLVEVFVVVAGRPGAEKYTLPIAIFGRRQHVRADFNVWRKRVPETWGNFSAGV
jgi:hypothetical protein